jgi:hypothetical protein
MMTLHPVHQFLGRFRRLAVEQHPHLAFLGADDHRLLAHPPYQVERCLRLAAQRLLQHVLRHALLQHLAQLGLDLEEAICRT